MLYTSEVTNKTYKTVEELELAEKEWEEAHNAELKAKEEKKAAAKKVEDAITLRIQTEQEAVKAKAEAYKAFLETCDEIDAKINETKVAEKEALTDFCDRYGAFHTTLTVGDNKYQYSYSNKETESNVISSYADLFKRLLDF